LYPFHDELGVGKCEENNFEEMVGK